MLTWRDVEEKAELAPQAVEEAVQKAAMMELEQAQPRQRSLRGWLAALLVKAGIKLDPLAAETLVLQRQDV